MVRSLASLTMEFASQNAPKNASNLNGISTPQVEPSVLSVEQLNREIKQLMEGQFDMIWVRGEISNFKPHSSGHFYFSLKDSRSQIRAVMFRGYNARLKFAPKDGLEVLIRGKITVYEPRGDYQISCELMEPVGAGALQKAFEQLKQKLKAEGLFESSRKRALPLLPKHVAIVTSPTGAAIRDMMNVLSRRFRSLRVTLIPTLVQGEGAAPQICEALKKAYKLENVDAIIVGRGGGSIEDLWAFNDESLARLIAQSPVPIISAVGHEIDFTIADFVADVRAPTPSAAAELVVKNADDLAGRVMSLRRLLTLSIQKLFRTESQKLHGLSRRLVDPKRRLQDLVQRNDELVMRLQNAVEKNIEARRMKLRLTTERMKTPQVLVQAVRARVERLQLRLRNGVSNLQQRRTSRITRLMAVLDSLSPLKVVDRGYSLIMKDNQLVKSSTQLKTGDVVEMKFAQGSATAKVESILSEK